MDSKGIKRLIESVIEDLTNDEVLNKILLKTQVIAHNLKNEKFSKWFDNEMNGSYETKEELPEYRVSYCEVFCNVSSISGMFKNLKVSVDMFSNEDAKKIAKFVYVYEPLLEIDEFANSKKSFKKFLPTVASFYINETLNPGWNVIDAWQSISYSTFKGIIETFKSRLLQFFLELNSEIELDINFNVMSGKKKIEKIMNTTINAGIVSTGKNSPINVQDSQIIGGKNNQVTLTQDAKTSIEKAIQSIEAAIKIFAESEDEVKIELERIKAQLGKKKPKINILKNSFDLLKGIFICEVS